MAALRFSCAFLVFMVLISEFYVAAASGEVLGNEAAPVLTDAEGTLDSAYRAFFGAELAGANVSGLLVQLNQAAQYLSLARTSYVQGDFGKASDFADSCQNVAGEVENAAVELKNSAFFESVQRMWFTMIGSIAGVVLVFLGSLGVWRVLKRRYYRQVFEMKPEVKSDES